MRLTTLALCAVNIQDQKKRKFSVQRLDNPRLRINVLAHPENGDDTAGRINDCSISLRISYSEIPESILHARSITTNGP